MVHYFQSNFVRVYEIDLRKLYMIITVLLFIVLVKILSKKISAESKLWYIKRWENYLFKRNEDNNSVTQFRYRLRFITVASLLILT